MRCHQVRHSWFPLNFKAFQISVSHPQPTIRSGLLYGAMSDSEGKADMTPTSF